MIYYYFNGKEGLYQAVLEKAYMDIRSLEERSKLLDMEPRAAMRKLIELTFDYDETHPQFISLVSVENIHQAKHLTNLQSIKDVNASVIRTLSSILERGRKEGVFRSDLDPVDVHLLISAFCFFRVSNRHTFGAIFDRDLSDPKLRKRHKKMIIEAIERLLEVRPAELRLADPRREDGAVRCPARTVCTNWCGSCAGSRRECRLVHFHCDGVDQRPAGHQAARDRRRRLRRRRNLRERSADLRRRHGARRRSAAARSRA